MPVLDLVQTILSAISILISIITITKVNQLISYNKQNNESKKTQIAIGKGNKQKINTKK